MGIRVRQLFSPTRFARSAGLKLFYGRLRWRRTGLAFHLWYALLAYWFNAVHDLFSGRFPLAWLYVSQRIVEVPFCQRAVDDATVPDDVVFELGSVVWPYLSGRVKEVTVCDWSYGSDPSDPSEIPANVTIMETDFLKAELPAESFDVVVSVSTVEHIGMGEYGDPLYADGDRAAVLGLYRLLKPGGLMVLGMPFGRIEDSWYRVYDPERFRSLMEGINVISVQHWIWRFPWWYRATEAQAAKADSTTRDRPRATFVIQARKERATGKPGDGGLS